MNRTLLICLPLLGLATLSGCHFSKKPAKPAENTAIVAEMEATFRQRWVDRRAAELTAQGLKPESAQSQAVEEFRVRYSYTGAAQK